MHKMVRGIWEPPNKIWWNKQTTRKYFIWWVKSYFLTLRDSLLKTNLKELTLWYTFTEVKIKNYFECELTFTIHTNVRKTETDAPLPDCLRVDVKSYLIKKVEGQVIIHPTLCWTKIINTSFDLFPACTITSSQRKVLAVPEESLVQCTYCTRRMKPTACVWGTFLGGSLFQAILQFENITPSLPLQVIIKIWICW